MPMSDYHMEPDYRKMILIVDDEEVNARILGEIFNEKYDVLYAENGQDALMQMSIYKDSLSAIILDLYMPLMDGYEVLESVAADVELRRIPVIVLTSDKEAEVKSLEMGAADFLSKPYDNPKVIIARVDHAIELYEDANIISATEMDALTGLYTREFFFEYAHKFDIYNSELETDAIVLNFNKFHLINELYGRKYGDQVLYQIGDAINDFLKTEEGIACRYDADTYYIYVGHQDDYDFILDYISGTLTELLNATELRFRMGIYTDVYRANTIEERFDRALLACNSLKKQYNNSYAVYDMEMHEKEIYTAQLLEDFEIAIDQKQFKVLFQPKYNIKGDVPLLSSAEALISWQHPEFGQVSPGAFIPLFEENGLIQKLDRYVWQESAIQMRKWKEEYGVTVPVSVNVSRVDIYDPEMPFYVMQIVAENELDPKDYLLEITESAYTDNDSEIVDVVNQLREEGFRVEMDDFGSGYSSLNMLATLPIDALKLDMAFIRNIRADNIDMRMVELILDIASFLKVPVIAEGVETKEQFDLLKNAGCDVIQGYYFSKPIPAEQFNLLIEEDIRKRK